MVHSYRRRRISFFISSLRGLEILPEVEGVGTRRRGMELTFEDLEDGVRRINLAGRMDVEGTQQIDLKFTSLSATTRGWIVVDLSAVEFMSSLGLGTLVRSAAAQSLRQGKLVLLAPRENVDRVLESTRIKDVIEVYRDFDTARRAVRSVDAAT
jgi:anti-sigma B factor antagonist